MNRTIILAFLLIFPILSIGQNKTDAENISEIDSYLKLIDSTATNENESLAEGPIIYNNIFKKNKGWEAYYLVKNNFLLRVRYSDTDTNLNKDINLYFKNNELVFAELIITYTKGKKKNMQPFKKRYYFFPGRLQWETKNQNEDYEPEEYFYNSVYISNEAKKIRKLINK